MAKRLLLCGVFTGLLLLPRGNWIYEIIAPTRATFERFTYEIGYFGRNDYLHGFRSRNKPAKEFGRFLEQSNLSANDFLPLLGHSSPRVRTLALVALYDLEDPKLLPVFFSQIKDKSETIMQAKDGPTGSITARYAKRQTVGYVATEILNEYLRSGGYFSFSGPLETNFEKYWKTHAHLSSFAGLWNIRLIRAVHGTSPTPVERIPAIKRLRAEIDKLAEPDRTFILLSLRPEYGADALISDNELIDLLQKLGPNMLIKILQRKIPSDDPDLQPKRSNNYVYGSMCIFILQHAKALLRSLDAQALLAQEGWERNFREHNIIDPLLTPDWAIAAAQLNNSEAVDILNNAHTWIAQRLYPGVHQLKLAEALWRLAGEGQVVAVVDWIYQELAHPDLLGSATANTIENILKLEGRNRNLFLKTLIEDARFNLLDWKSLEVLATTMPAISKEELDSFRSPVGGTFYMQDLPNAMKQDSQRIAEITETLDKWRKMIRLHIQKDEFTNSSLSSQ